MATQSNTFAERGYGSTLVDSLVWGAGWVDAYNNPITYHFSSGTVTAAESSIGAFDGAVWTTAQMDAFRTALDEYEAVANVRFVEAADKASANMVWHMAPEANFATNVLGSHDVPDGAQPQVQGYFNRDAAAMQDLTPGSTGFVVVIHELGHGMGLAHPHDGGTNPGATTFPSVSAATSLGANAQNQGVYTTMSYNNGWNGEPATTTGFGAQAAPMALDIAALQAIYGANSTTNAGDNTYDLPTANASGTGWTAIWDTDGEDTVSAAAATTAVTINLNAATLSGSNAGGYISAVKDVQGGVTIAKGAVLENAIGGSGNDTLVGNAAANVLTGGAGQDTMSGGAGNDVYYIDNALDRIGEKSGQGVDQVIASVDYALAGHVENLVLVGAVSGTGNAQANTITGNALDNVLNGGVGNDQLIGGAGDDIYIVDNARERLVEVAGEGDDTARTYVDYTLPQEIENLELIGNNPIKGTGNALDNVITGNRGNNLLDGGAGADTLIGGLGNDFYVVDNIGDVATEAANAGNDSVQASISYVLPANIEHLTLTGKANIDGTGSNGENYIIGNSGNNILYGLDGKDRLSGGSGNDTLIGGAGVDTLTGGGGGDVFRFEALNESGFTASGRDTISDFTLKHGDQIDLSAIDADINQAGDQAFVLITGSVFTAAGQVMVNKGLLTAEVDGDGVADFSIKLIGVVTLTDPDILIG